MEDPILTRGELVYPNGCPRVVLVVDDHPVNRRVLGHRVRRMGYEVQEATGGQEAVRLASESLFVAVLLDCHMPEVDGLEATRRIRMLSPPHRAVPIFAVTADGREGYREVCLRAGMDDYTEKPIKAEVIEGLLQRATSAWGPAETSQTCEG